MADTPPPNWRRYLRFWKRDIAGDVHDEVAFHLESVVEELRARGMSDADARRVAAQRFGDVGGIAASMRSLAEERARSRDRAELLRTAWADLRYSTRALARSGGTIAAVILTLAIGLGATAATFSLLDQLFWRPPAGVAQADEVHRVWVHEESSWDGARHARAAAAVPQIDQVRRALDGVAPVGAYIADTAWRIGNGSERARVGFANRAYFDVLGVRPARGRLFDASEDDVTVPAPVAVVSARFAERWLADSASVVGSVLRLQDQPYTVVGVMPGDFTGVDLQATDVWLPLGSFRDDPRMRGGRAPWFQRNDPIVRGLARLGAGIPAPSLAQRASDAVRDFHRQRGWTDTLVAVSFAPAVGVRGPGDARPEVRVATRAGIVGGIILLIACANVANLFLARAVQRRREFAIRASLGISRRRLLAMLSMESALVAVAAAVLAALVTWWVGHGLRALLFPELTLAGRVLHWRVAAVALALAFASSWIVSVMPALQVARPHAADALRLSAASSPRASRVRATLTALQVALAFVLLTAAGAFATSLRRVQLLDIGFDAAHTVSAEVVWEDRTASPPGEVLAAGLRRVQARVSDMPGVEASALSLAGPMDGSWAYLRWYAGLDSSRRDTEPSTWPVALIVERDFFSATGLTIVEGRTFADVPAGTRVGEVLVNQTMARRAWPDGNAIGECMHLSERSTPCSRVVGIVEDSPRSEVLEDAHPLFFVPVAEWEPQGWTPSVLVARVAPEAQAVVVGELRRLLRDEFPTGMARVSSLEDALAPQFRQWRLGATLFGGFGLLALLVTIAGIYSTTAYGVAQRAREFGIRIALGAQRGNVVRDVFHRLGPNLALGVLLGAAGAIAVGRVIQGLLYDVSANDPVFYGMAAVTLVVAACVAAVGPALRASRESPLAVMRAE